MKRFLWRKRQKSQEGQAMVEFALTIPIFLAILFGFIMFAWMFYAYLTVVLSAREGASLLVRDPKTTVSAIETRVRSTSISFDQSALTVSINPSDPAQWVPGLAPDVTASYLIPIPIITIPNLKGPATRIFGPITVSATSKMTIE